MTNVIYLWRYARHLRGGEIGASSKRCDLEELENDDDESDVEHLASYPEADDSFNTDEDDDSNDTVKHARKYHGRKVSRPL